MREAERVLADAVAEGKLPFAVAMVSTSQGTTFSASAGDAAEGRAAEEDTVFRIFSMSKAIGSLAALILIDRGTLSPDTPVAELLPEWNDLQVLEGWDSDAPRLRPQKTVATLRHLATHTAGIEYEFWNADVAKYLETQGHPPGLSGLKAALNYPLTSDPGSRWSYGLALDWLGRMVEAADGRRIDAFCREEIFEPLGMTDTAFEPDGLTDRLAEVKMRKGEGFRPTRLSPPPNPEVYGMGHALYSTAPDYLRFLRMVLNGGELDGTRILSPQAMELMMQDQMPMGVSFERMTTVAPPVSADVDLFPGSRVGHSLAFLRNDSDIAGKRSAGSLGWAGVCNTHYWVDPARDVAAVLMTQSLPFLEPPMVETYDAFERAIYAEL